jgi:hypothetical protein
MTPEENTAIGPGPQPKLRRTVRFSVPEETLRPSEPSDDRVATPADSSTKDRVLLVAEQVVGDWAPTLRDALVRVLVFVAVLLAVGIAFGVGVAVVFALIGVVMFLAGRCGAGTAG